MLDDAVIYEGRKVSGRTRHNRIPRGSSVEFRGSAAARAPPSGERGMLPEDAREPELSHPGRGEARGLKAAAMSSDMAKATVLRNIGKEAFMSVVRETVELVALEAASHALQEETDRMEICRQAERRERHSSRSHRRAASRGVDMSKPGHRSGMPSHDSASGSMFDEVSPAIGVHRSSSSNGHANGTTSSSDRHRRRSRNMSMAHGGVSTVVASVAAGGGGTGTIGEEAEVAEERSMTFKNTTNSMEDDERETLLALLTGAYSQVNELTDELQISLDKLHETEKQLKAFSRSESNSQLLPKTVGAPAGEQAASEEDSEEATERPRTNNPNKPVSKFLKGFFPSDEGSKSTPANVRQLQVEVQRLRQRITQASTKEEKYRADLARSQRLMAVMEAQLSNSDEPGLAVSPQSTASRGAAKRSASSVVDAGGKPLVDRVAELEEKLVNCSMENATAKQDYLAAKLRGSQLEKNTERLRHELAKSRAMNDLLQNEIDRLQGIISPEGEADGMGWRRWLGGLQEPMSPEPHPIKVSGDSDSPVVVVRDLDNNQLVYAPGRSEFM